MKVFRKASFWGLLTHKCSSSNIVIYLGEFWTSFDQNTLKGEMFNLQEGLLLCITSIA
jgi:hypothetical protein